MNAESTGLPPFVTVNEIEKNDPGEAAIVSVVIAVSRNAVVSVVTGGTTTGGVVASFLHPSHSVAEATSMKSGRNERKILTRIGD